MKTNSIVVVNLQSPKERFFGRLIEISTVRSFGFRIASIDAKTHVPKSRVGLGLIEAQLRDRG